MISNKIISRFIQGKITLWKSYWLVGELLNGLIILIIFNLEIYFFNTNSSITQIPFFNLGNFNFISKIIILLWTMFISIGIWRSAENYKGNIIWIVATFLFYLIEFLL